MIELRIPYAVDPSGALVSSADAPRHQNYECPNCRAPVILRRGEVRVPHFAHRPNNACSGEGIIHRTAKLLLVKTIRDGISGAGPMPVVMRQCSTCQSFVNGSVSSLVRSVEQERWTSNRLRVDVALYDGESALVEAIEVFVAHAVDPAKHEEIPVPYFEVDGKAVLDHPLALTALQCKPRPVCPLCVEAERLRLEYEREAERIRIELEEKMRLEALQAEELARKAAAEEEELALERRKRQAVEQVTEALSEIESPKPDPEAQRLAEMRSRFNEDVRRVVDEIDIEIPDRYFRYGIALCEQCKGRAIAFAWPRASLKDHADPKYKPPPSVVKLSSWNGTWWVNTCQSCNETLLDPVLHGMEKGPFFGLDVTLDSDELYRRDMDCVARHYCTKQERLISELAKPRRKPTRPPTS